MIAKFATVLGGKLQEADAATVKEFAKWVAAKMKQVEEAATKKEDRYVELERE